ncbi:unnamed protein product [Schistosoma turkestanicum]|nr:unnamed protein product [Schistosoma turkestanicum]
MCLPTAAPIGPPGCCPTRNYSKSRKRNASSQGKEKPKVDNQPHGPSDYSTVISKIDGVQIQSESNSKVKQTNERREKSRIAARQRRHRENQSLVELYLTLPIQQNLAVDVLKNKCHKVGQLEGDSNEQISDSLTESVSLLNTVGQLDFVPTYRLAATIFRQHNLSTPVLEKAVIVRIASNSLCLYNWLYPSFESDSNTKSRNKLPPEDSQSTELDSSLPSVTCDNTTAATTIINSMSSSGVRVHTPLLGSTADVIPKPLLSVHSQCLVAVIVDVTHNIIIYAPPAYTELIGLSWVTTIGLKLNELVARQVAMGVSSKLRSHNCCHHLRDLQYSKYNCIENMINKNSKQKCVQSELAEMEYVECNPIKISKHALKSTQIHQEFEQPLSCEMIWPSSYGVTSRPLGLSSILPKPTSMSLSHMECSEPSNDEKDLSVQDVQDPTTTDTSISKHIMNQYALCWNSSNVCIRNTLSKYGDLTLDISCSSSSSSSSSSPFPFSNNHNIINRANVDHCNTTEMLQVNNDSNDFHSISVGSENESTFTSNDTNLRIYLLQPIHLSNMTNSMNNCGNKWNHGACINGSNHVTNCNINSIPDSNNNTKNSSKTNNSKNKNNSFDFSLNPSFSVFNENKSNAVEKNNSLVKFFNSCGSCRTGLSDSFKTYHSPTNLQFIDIANDFLDQLGYTKVELLNKCLFDLIHIDDLVHISEAMNTVNENQPVITSFYRLRLKCGTYCWARMLIYHMKRSHYHMSNASSILTNDQPYNYQNQMNKISDCCMNCNECCFKKFDNSNSSSHLATLDGMNSYDSCTSSDLLICCHQLFHFYHSNDVCESLSTIEKVTSNCRNDVKQQQQSQVEPNKYQYLHENNEFASYSSVFTSQSFTKTLTDQQNLMTKSTTNNGNQIKCEAETSAFVSNSYGSHFISIPASSYYIQDESKQMDTLIPSSSSCNEKEISSTLSFDPSISLSSQHCQRFGTTSREKDIHIANNQEVTTVSTIGAKLKLDEHHLLNHSVHSVVSGPTITVSDSMKRSSPNLPCLTTELYTYNSPTLKDKIYHNKLENACLTTAAVVNTSVEPQSKSQIFKQTLPNKAFNSSEQYENQKNPFNCNPFSDPNNYRPPTNCYNPCFNDSNSHSIVQKPHVTSYNTSEDIFDYSTIDYNPEFLPQVNICPVFNGIVQKESDNVYFVPPKKPCLYPLTSNTTNNNDTNEFNQNSSNFNYSNKSFNGFVNTIQSTNFLNHHYSIINNEHVNDATNYYLNDNDDKNQPVNNYELFNPNLQQHYHQTNQCYFDYQQQQQQQQPSQSLTTHHYHDHQQSYTLDNFTNNSTLIY